MKKKRYAVLDCNGCVLGEVEANSSDEAKAQAYLDFGAAVYSVEVMS